MTENVRTVLDAFDVLMQDHRELEALFLDFEHAKRTGANTAPAMAAACTELKIHDTLETQILYTALAACSDETVKRLAEEAEAEHDTVLELLEKLDRSHNDERQRDACFNRIMQHMKEHIRVEETQLFPRVKKLEGLDFAALDAALIKRQQELFGALPLSQPA